jgi:hypothetical protein
MVGWDARGSKTARARQWSRSPEVATRTWALAPAMVW